MIPNPTSTAKINFDRFQKRVLSDYRIVYLSRSCSLLGRREVLTGKGNFGIFGDGKELPQIAINHFFKPRRKNMARNFLVGRSIILASLEVPKVT